MTLYAVEGVSTQGNETVIFVPALVNPNAPKLTEAGSGATAALNLGYALRGFSPSSDQGSSEDIRLASTQTFENPGRVKSSLDDITYVYDPQAAPGAASNKHYTVLVQGVKGFLIDRRGIPATTPLAVGDKVDVYPVQMGDQRRVGVDPSAEGGKFEIVQKPFVIGLVLKDVAVVA